MNVKHGFPIAMVLLIGLGPVALCAAEVAAPAGGPGPARGPLHVCQANPRYFCDDTGRIVYLAGAHDGWELQDNAWGDENEGVVFDWDGFLDFLVRHDHNVARLWSVEHTKINDNDADLTTPMPYLRAANAGKANDGGEKFDLDRLNPAYFDRLRRRTLQARDRGVYVIVMLFQGWSIEDKGGRVNPWPYHPFHRENNISGVDGDLDGDGQGKELHSWLGENHPITRLQRAYVRRVIETVNDLDNVLYEIANESHGESLDWQGRMVEYIHQVERSKAQQHPVGITVPFGVPRKPGLNALLFKSPADWISPNREAGGGYDYRHNPPPADGGKVVLSDTDHLFGTGGKNAAWVWKTFLRGHNPLYMDRWTIEPNDPDREAVRKALGCTRRLAERIDLAAMTPRVDMASTGYCLADPGARYLVYSPDGVAVTVDLSSAEGEIAVKWIDPRTGGTTGGASVRGGGPRAFHPPGKGDAVLLLEAVPDNSQRP